MKKILLSQSGAPKERTKKTNSHSCALHGEFLCVLRDDSNARRVGVVRAGKIDADLHSAELEFERLRPVRSKPCVPSLRIGVEVGTAGQDC